MTTSHTMNMIDRAESSVRMWCHGKNVSYGDLLAIIKLAREAEQARIDKAMEAASLIET